MRASRLRLAGLLFATLLVASACGGGSDDSKDAGGSDSGSGSSGEVDVSKAVDIAPGTTLDLPSCPSDWDPKQGITADKITLFMSLPESGPVAALGTIDDGMRAYFDQMAPIDGKKVELKTADDAYDPARTLSNTKEALDTVKPFAFVDMIGTPNNLAIRDTLQQNCTPQLFNSTGFPAWGDPAKYPWTIGGLLAYNTEAKLWCNYIADKIGKGTKVAGLFMDNEFGKTYQKGMEDCSKEGKIKLVKSVNHDPAAPSVTSQSTTLAASGADVIVLGTTGAACSQSMAALAKTKAQKILSYTCQSVPAYFKPIDPAGNGVIVAVSGKDSSMTEDPEVQKAIAVLKAKGLDAQKGSYFTGVIFAHQIEQTLQAAVKQEGGLNRVNLMKAVWNMNATNPLALDGSSLKTAGVDDAYLIEAARFARYVAPKAGQAVGHYEFIGDLLNSEGQTGSVSNPK